MNEQYPHPPITEAVIDFRFGGSSTEAALQTARLRLLKEYPKSEDLREVKVSIGGAGGAEVLTKDLIGYKLTSADGTRITQVRPEMIATSQLAPYHGWETLLDQAKYAVSRAAKLYTGRSLTRIGLRYVNRIDIPVSDDEVINHADYLTIGISAMPFEHQHIGAMYFTLSTTVDGGRFGVQINCGRVASPLINQVSILFDIDVYNQQDMPRKRSGMWVQLEEMRDVKNTIFEACLTDQARKLFR